MVQLGATPSSVEVAVEPEAGDLVNAVAGGRGGRAIVLLELGGVRFDEQPEYTYEVYVNLPPGRTPGHQLPNYVGSVASYAPPGHETTTQLDITAAVRALGAAGAWDSRRVRLTFVPSGVEPPPGMRAPPPEPRSFGGIARVRIAAAGA